MVNFQKKLEFIIGQSKLIIRDLPNVPFEAVKLLIFMFLFFRHLQQIPDVMNWIPLVESFFEFYRELLGNSRIIQLNTIQSITRPPRIPHYQGRGVIDDMAISRSTWQLNANVYSNIIYFEDLGYYSFFHKRHPQNANFIYFEYYYICFEKFLLR